MFAEIMVNNQHFDKQVYRFTNKRFCQSDGYFVPLWKALTLRVFAEYILSLHGTIYQHKTATKQA